MLNILIIECPRCGVLVGVKFRGEQYECPNCKAEFYVKEVDEDVQI